MLRTEHLAFTPKNVFQPRGFGKTLFSQINSAENLCPFPALQETNPQQSIKAYLNTK